MTETSVQVAVLLPPEGKTSREGTVLSASSIPVIGVTFWHFQPLLDNGRLNYSLPSAAVWPGLCQAMARGLPPPPLPQGLGGLSRSLCLGAAVGLGLCMLGLQGEGAPGKQQVYYSGV